MSFRENDDRPAIFIGCTGPRKSIRRVMDNKKDIPPNIAWYILENHTAPEVGADVLCWL
jgi:hypothetical protein